MLAWSPAASQGRSRRSERRASGERRTGGCEKQAWGAFRERCEVEAEEGALESAHKRKMLAGGRLPCRCARLELAQRWRRSPLTFSRALCLAHTHLSSSQMFRVKF